ncbi:uncharacterized protein BX664DRAFT_60239 [Halteromyces radiatus]|uniref:uncharacterized protein n=1 Tax=Halteromyces radiatus TaxID=101107 RepID=UPI002220F6D1|nr:uncharacterized protein BX664DRAFT_60239 [Halteromyces radiatus]KAI8096488.1 hypothetical protein BX664DRAFT_60239 [Halteromyces radiatus]
MIVAFGFTGVSTSLTVMSDVEVLDITTWSWTSYYVPSLGYPGNGDNHNIGGDGNQLTLSGTPSMAIVAGAVTGGLVVFVLIIVALYIFNFHQKERPSPTLQDGMESSNKDSSIPPMDHTTTCDPFTKLPKSVLSASPLLSNNHLKRNSSSLPSPWKDHSSSQWNVRRSTTTSGLTHHLPISKPDEPANYDKYTIIRRVATQPLHHSLYMEKVQNQQNENSNNDNDDDDGFDRQEFILHSGEISDQHTVVDTFGKQDG